MLSPSLHLGAISRLWGHQLLQYIEANTWSLDFHVFFHSGTTPLILLKTSVSHPSNFFWCSGTTLFWLPHSGTPSNSSGFFSFSGNGNVVHAHPFQTPWGAPMISPLTGTLRVIA